MKKIILADHAGYCFGVKRAMKLAWDELENKENKKIFALGPLIHNKQAVEKYEEKGLITINDIEDIDSRNVNPKEVIIRSHGVAKEVYDQADKKNLEIVDTTCPFVKKIHELAKESYEKGKKIIVIGDKNHPEVIGINGWCDNKAIIIKELKELFDIELDYSVEYVVVSQTTMNEREFDAIIDYLKGKNINMVVNNTICSATKVRQQSAREISNKVDLMIVIGGKHSSNTQKLVSICKESVDTIAIETKADLIDFDLGKYDTIGVTAGASTPDWIIEETIEYIENGVI